jgi:hypothetical protein
MPLGIETVRPLEAAAFGMEAHRNFLESSDPELSSVVSTSVDLIFIPRQPLDRGLKEL